jgi:hypothetical protein
MSPRRPRRATPPAKTVSAPLSFPAWKAAAVAKMGGRTGTMPERGWKRLFIAGTDFEEAARQAQMYRDLMSAARRSR